MKEFFLDKRPLPYPIYRKRDKQLYSIQAYSTSPGQTPPQQKQTPITNYYHNTESSGNITAFQRQFSSDFCLIH
jgi:hypothetical protein